MSTAKKVPLRQCIGLRMQENKKEMIRVLKTPEGEFTIDATGRKWKGRISVPVYGVFGTGSKRKGLRALL